MLRQESAGWPEHWLHAEPSRDQPHAAAELSAGHGPSGNPLSALLVPPDVGTAQEGKERKKA